MKRLENRGPGPRTDSRNTSSEYSVVFTGQVIARVEQDHRMRASRREIVAEDAFAFQAQRADISRNGHAQRAADGERISIGVAGVGKRSKGM